MASLVRREVGRVSDVFDWFEHLPNLFATPMVGLRAIRVEEFREEDRYVLRAELPGVDPEKDVVIEVKDGVLAISAERKESQHAGGRSEFHYGRFVRRMVLPTGTDESAIKARYEAGILEITIPLTAEQPEPHTIPIEKIG